jgi:hypothetical protein
MSKIITRLFDVYSDALRAVAELEGAGVAHQHISIIANDAEDVRAHMRPAEDHVGADAGRGAVAGGALGGGVGLLAGLGVLAVPGLGPVVAAGWLAAAAVGAAVGAVAGGAVGGVVGALVNAGETEANANVYAEGVRRGGTLVSVRAHDNQAGLVENVLDRFNAVTAADRGSVYRAQGWDRFDDKAPPYTDEEVLRERAFFRR